PYTVVFHYFPTRRSSDLLVSGRHLRVEFGGLAAFDQRGVEMIEHDRIRIELRRIELIDRILVDHVGVGFFLAPKVGSKEETDTKDRKSTRLNSSHDQISY